MQEEHTPETEPAHSSEAPGTANTSGHDSETSAANECAAGMMPRLLWSLFDKKRKIEAAGLERVEIVMSYVQVYCEKIHDLLADPSLPDSERGLILDYESHTGGLDSRRLWAQPTFVGDWSTTKSPPRAGSISVSTHK